MKKLFSSFSILLSSVIGLYAQTSDNVYSSSSYTNKSEKDNSYTTTGLPGDNLNLYLVLNAFKQSNSVEDFEKRINDPASKINNLDLNNDGTIDYLKATDYGKDDYHTVVIQDIISASETQDVAVIDIQKNNNNTAHIQIIGDESLYGKDYIIEPQAENSAPQTQQTQPGTIINNNYYTVENPAPYVNVWGWPCVSFFFGSAYIPWVSPWHWVYYPSWWIPRPRVIYHIYYGYHRDFSWNYYCRRNYFVNQPRYYSYYNSRRVISPTVQVNVTKNVYHNAPRGAGYNNTGNYKYNDGWNSAKNGNQPNNINIEQKPKWNKGNKGYTPDNNGEPKTNGKWNGSNNTNNPSQPKPDNGNNHWNSSGNHPKPNMNKDQNYPKNNGGWKGGGNGGYKGGGKGNGSGIKMGTKVK